MSMRGILVSLLLFSSSVVWSQSELSFPNIQIDIEDGNGYAPCEPSIVIHPKNPKKIMAAVILDKVYTSNDGGYTWEKENLESSMGVFGDPCLVANSKGDFYYLHLSNPSGLGWSDDGILDRIVCQRSKNMKKWSDGAGIGLNGSKDQDKEWAVTNPENDDIYVTWTQFDKYDSSAEGDSTVILFSKSDKCAKEFSAPVRISQLAGDCLDDDETTEGAVPAVGPNGEIYVAWAVNNMIYFDRSFDGGDTWLENDIEAGEIVGGWALEIPGISRCNGMPVLKCDLSESENRGRLYINWTDQRNGTDNTDVWLIYSDDKGNTWSDPIKVNQDEAERHQFFTWFDIDSSSGSIYCIYYDRRNTEGNATDVFLSASHDGGLNFKDYKISSSSFTPNSKIFFGDYNNISASKGHVRPIWTRYENNKLSIWTAIISSSELN